jgi:hypothetical protein
LDPNALKNDTGATPYPLNMIRMERALLWSIGLPVGRALPELFNHVPLKLIRSAFNPVPCACQKP